MAIYRTIPTTFWEDTKVVDDFTPEDRYFLMYCLTNPRTNLCGCYETSIKQMSLDLGYIPEVVDNLLERLSNIHKVIEYDYTTKELFVVNWSKYNWTKSEKLNKPLLNEIKQIKSSKFKEILIKKYNARDTVSIPYTYPMDTTCIDTTVTVSVTDTVSNTVTDTVSDTVEKKKEIIRINKEDFEEIWKEYPRKDGKKKSLEYINRALKSGATVQEIKNGVLGYKKYIEENKVEPRYIKMGSTFFNQENWRDFEEQQQKEDKRIEKRSKVIMLKPEQEEKKLEIGYSNETLDELFKQIGI